MRIGALIPAKLTSTRLERKNILPLNGKPLLYWSVKCALDSDIFCNVTVSSENDEVLDIVRIYFSESEVTCLRRPAEMSSKYASLQSVMRHYLDSVGGLDYLSLLMPTSPFRSPERIRNEIAPHLMAGRLEQVISLDSMITPNVDYFLQQPDGRYFMVFIPNIHYCRHCNSTYHFQKVNSLFSSRPHRPNESILRIVCSFREAIDINTPEEYKLASMVGQYGAPAIRPLRSYEMEECRVTVPEGVDVNAFVDFIGGDCLHDGALKVILGKATNLFAMLDLNQVIEVGMSGMPYYLSMCHQYSELEHSQLHPKAFIRNPHYFISSKTRSLCRWGEKSLEISPGQVMTDSELLAWDGYIEPFLWNNMACKPEGSHAARP